MRNLVRLMWLAALTSVFLIASPTSRLFAEGESNPTGVSSVFNGNVTTGCSYDPSTGNFRREIDDIVVPGTVGTYPLKFTRTYNSRGSAPWEGEVLLSGPLGNSMGQNWRHSYSLTVGSWGQLTGDKAREGFVFPDGRVISADPTSNFPPIEERFDDATHNWVMADGGKVHLGYDWGFIAWSQNYFGGSGVSADRITDPTAR